MVGSATLGLALLTLLMGGLGYWMGLRAVDKALAFVDAGDRAVLRQRGEEEARNALYLGALAAALPLLLGAGTVTAGLSRRRTQRASGR